MNKNVKYACAYRGVMGFRAAVCLALMSTVGLHAVADELTSAAQQQPALPPVKSGKPFYYPDKAKRIGLEGTVLIEFNIDAKGKPAKLTVLRADDPVFSSAAMELLAGTRFEWQTTGLSRPVILGAIASESCSAYLRVGKWIPL